MKKFWVQFSIFILFALVIPVTYLIIKYDLFITKETTEVITTTTRTTKIGLVGIFVFVIVLIVASALIKFYLEGMKTKYSMTKQVVLGIIKLIVPLFIMLVVVWEIGTIINKINLNAVEEWLATTKNSIKELKESIIFVIPCEAIAIVINPLPKWCFDNNIDGLTGIAQKIMKGE